MRSEAPDVVYHVRTLAQGMPATLTSNMHQSPMRYSMMRCAAYMLLACCHVGAVRCSHAVAPDVVHCSHTAPGWEPVLLHYWNLRSWPSRFRCRTFFATTGVVCCSDTATTDDRRRVRSVIYCELHH